jgi:hypothetical protein
MIPIQDKACSRQVLFHETPDPGRTISKYNYIICNNGHPIDILGKVTARYYGSRFNGKLLEKGSATVFI